MKIKSIKYRIPGISDFLLESLSDTATINLLNQLYYLTEMYVDVIVENTIANFEDLILKDTTRVSFIPEFETSISNNLTKYEFLISNKKARIDFSNMVDLKGVNENLGIMLLKMKSENFYEQTVAQMVFNVMDYL
jgi:tyrosine-protein phosphatase YwqE